MDALAGPLAGLLQIMWVNIVLSGDNAVVIGLAAAGLPAAQRARVVLFGVVAAAVLRVVFSIFASFLLALWWVEIIGGVVLLYIAWTFFRELRQEQEEEEHPGEQPHVQKTLMQAMWQIILADVSMSLDNVLAVAAVARNDFVLLIVGLGVSIVMMGLLGNYLARLLTRYRWIAYLGVALIAYIGLELTWEGLLQANANLGLGLPLPESAPAEAG